MNIADKTQCKVPFGTMTVTPDVFPKIADVLSKRMLTNGKYVAEFESKFAEKMGAKYAIAVSSGTDADTLALASLYELGAKRGDEVIIPALTFVATANAVVNAGFVPVFVDVDEYTLNIDVYKIEDAITSKTRAIMPVHLMGKPAQMEGILDIARRHRLNVIEDAAEAHGAMYKGKMVGTVAPISAFSLYAAHIISSIEGGMILTSSKLLNDVIRSLRNHGLQLQGSNWTFERIGYSSKMNELEAIVGLGNLEKMDEIVYKRQANFKYLKKRLDKHQEFFYTINEGIDERLSPHAFPIILRENCSIPKYQFTDYLTYKGIDHRNLFYSLPTQSKCYRYLGYQYGSFPMAEKLSELGTHIGIHQDLSLEQLDYVADSIDQFIKDVINKNV